MKICEFGDFRLDLKSHIPFQQTGELVSRAPRDFNLILTLVESYPHEFYQFYASPTVIAESAHFQ